MCNCSGEMSCGCSHLVIDKIKACTQRVNSLDAEFIVANDICSQKVRAKEAWSDKAYTNSLCVSGSASINNLCVNKLQANDFEVCNVYRAAATFSSNISYNLGSLVNWNVIVDDPNGDVALAPFSYTLDSDQAGYYAFNYHLDVSNLQGAATIVGSPIGWQQLMVNGIKLVDQFTPFLGFSSSQGSQFSGLVLLQGGDVITMKYDVLVLDSVSGLIPYVGTVDLSGNGSLIGKSFFTIVKIAGLCASGTTPSCPQCPIVEIPCQPVTIPCDPCV